MANIIILLIFHLHREVFRPIVKTHDKEERPSFKRTDDNIKFKDVVNCAFYLIKKKRISF